MFNTLIILVGLFNAVVIAYLVFQWEALYDKTKKMMVFICLAVVPIVWGALVIQQDLLRTQKVSYCANCHTMTEHVESLTIDDNKALSAIHYQNNWVPQEIACYFCHSRYTMFGPTSAKIRGVKHLWAYYVAGPPKTLKLYEAYDNRDCLRCHGASKKYRSAKFHRAEETLLTQLDTGARSCLEIGCHTVGHRLAARTDDENW